MLVESLMSDMAFMERNFGSALLLVGVLIFGAACVACSCTIVQEELSRRDAGTAGHDDDDDDDVEGKLVRTVAKLPRLELAKAARLNGSLLAQTLIQTGRAGEASARGEETAPALMRSRSKQHVVTQRYDDLEYFNKLNRDAMEISDEASALQRQGSRQQAGHARRQLRGRARVSSPMCDYFLDVAAEARFRLGTLRDMGLCVERSARMPSHAGRPIRPRIRPERRTGRSNSRARISCSQVHS